MCRVFVLRMGHRPVRDHRVTTHVGLVARAFGADGIFLEEHVEESVVRTLRKVTEVWGGGFEVSIVSNPITFIKNWKKSGGVVVHLTMYGINITERPNLLTELRERCADILVVVGGEKMPREVFDLADYNIAIGNQPHSEVAALAVFLDRFFEGRELIREFKGAKLKVIPSERGKILKRVGEDEERGGIGNPG
uniref:tRNA (cytidine(56)-2'-O)-methyltransferase n=1 Tax=Thermofilum pendens TaxID=2269 RepID=A0A7C4FE36_THEPE